MVAIVPYEPAHEPAVRAFNERLAAAGIHYAFPTRSIPSWLPPAPGERLWQEMFLAMDDGVVRGGYIAKHQDFVVAGEVMSVGAIQLPLSEGVIDRSFLAVGVQLLRHALKLEPLLYTLGIGGVDEAAARLLIAARFGVDLVPFLFRVERGRPFLRNIQVLRRTRLRRAFTDLAAMSRLGPLAIAAAHRLRTNRRGARDVEASSPDAFGPDVDQVWTDACAGIAFGAVRDARVLRRLYDQPGNRFIRVEVRDGGRLRGWAVVLATHGRGHKHFGDMHVGSIVDLLAVPGYERAIVDASVARLRREGVDLILSNQSLGPVVAAFRDAGFLKGPSNFLVAMSPALTNLTGPVPQGVASFHLNRGDGDGPINL